jgi:hypothetical protein
MYSEGFDVRQLILRKFWFRDAVQTQRKWFVQLQHLYAQLKIVSQF